jgi:hypothetical protein
VFRGPIPARLDRMKTEPWKQYFDDFRTRTDRIPADAFDRGRLLYEAAHNSYQATTDRLTADGLDGERALMYGRMFGAVVKEWVAQGGQDIDRLERDLQHRYEDWTANDTAGDVAST